MYTMLISNMRTVNRLIVNLIFNIEPNIINEQKKKRGNYYSKKECTINHSRYFVNPIPNIS